MNPCRRATRSNAAATLRSRRPRPLTFAEYADEWLEEAKQRRAWKPRTERVNRDAVRRLRPFFGPLRLGAIRPRDVAAFIREALGDFAPATVNLDVNVLVDVFNSAIREELSETNPAAHVERPRAGAHFDVYAHHPYAARNPPDWVPPDSRWIALGNIGRLTGLVRRLYGPRMRVWLTEFGYRTNPPDNGWSISWAKQAQYLEDAYWIARANPRIDMLVWYQLRDDTAPNGWGSGLLTSTSLKKPAYRTFATLARR